MNNSDLELIRYKLDDLEIKIMAAIDDKIAEVNRSFDVKARAILDAVAALRIEVADAKEKAVTPEALAALDAVDGKIDAFDPTLPATLPEGEAPGSPATPPTEGEAPPAPQV